MPFRTFVFALLALAATPASAHVAATYTIGAVEVRVLTPVDGPPDTVMYVVFDSTYLDHGGLAALAAADTALARTVIVGVPVLADRELNWAAVRLEHDAGMRYRRLLLDEVVPAVEATLGVEGARRVLLGYSAGAVLALDLALEGEGAFERVALQSPGWMSWDAAAQRVGANQTPLALARIGAACGTHRTAVWFMWGDGPDEWEARSRDNGLQVMEALGRCTSVVDGGRWPGDHGLHLVRDSLGAAVSFLVAP